MVEPIDDILLRISFKFAILPILNPFQRKDLFILNDYQSSPLWGEREGN